MSRSTFVYVTYIRTTAQELWAALTDTDFMTQYWFGTRCESGWTAGSPWRMVHRDGHVTDSGHIIEADPPRRMVIHWEHQFKPELKEEGPARCTIELEPIGPAVKLTITHTMEKDPSKLIVAVSGGWPKIISNLKSLLETGEVAIQEPYPAGTSDAVKA